jgi:DNA (cytosine-5)-methyltransferase 1
VTVDVAEWLGHRLRKPGHYDPSSDGALLSKRAAWPRAAWGRGRERYVADVSAWPVHRPSPRLEEFLRYPTTPLSAKATAGFFSRAQRAKLNFPPGFLELVEDHLASL